MGYRCADILLRIWNGEHVDKFNYINRQNVYSGTAVAVKSDTEVDHATCKRSDHI